MVSLNASLLLKFLGFFRSRIARLGKKVVVAALLAAKDIRSYLGKNLALVREVSGGLDPGRQALYSCSLLRRKGERCLRLISGGLESSGSFSVSSCWQTMPICR